MSKKHLENRVESLEYSNEDLEDLEIVIGEGPDKWAIEIDTGEISEGQDDE